MNHIRLQRNASVSTTITAIIVVIVIIVAAAGVYTLTLSKSTSTSTSSTSSTSSSTTASTTSSSRTSSTTSSSSQPPIVIGMVTHQSGSLAPVGVSQINGAQLAVNQINANGGVLGRQLQLVVKDEGASSSDALTSVQTLINVNHANLMICCALSGDAAAAVPTLIQNNIVSVCALCSLNALFVAPTNQLLFGNSLPDSGYASAALAWLQLVGAKNYVFIGEYYSFISETANFVGNASLAAGIKIAASPSYFPPSTTDFTSLINNIAAIHPSAVIDFTVGGEVVSLQQQYAGNPAVSSIPILHMDTLLSISSFANQVQKAVPNGMNNVFIMGPNTFTNTTASYVKSYSSQFNITSSYIDQDTYSAIIILSQAVQRAGTLNTTAIVNALLQTNYVGPDGHVVMQSNHAPQVGTNYLSGTLYQWQLTGGSLHYDVIWPPVYANTTAIIP